VKHFIERVLEKRIRNIPSYKNKLSKWGRDPKEKAMVFDLATRMFLSATISTWVVSSGGLIFALISYFEQDFSSMRASIFFSLLLAATGFSLHSSSADYEEKHGEEIERYQKAKEGRILTERLVGTITLSTTSAVKDKLRFLLENNISLKKLDIEIGSLLALISGARTSIKEVYNANKTYDYNVNEPYEIEAFSKVDAFLSYEIAGEKLDKVFSLVESLRVSLERGGEDLQEVVEKILSL